MLQNLHVKNLALIDECEVEFSDGLNILSGETGAGKSIIIGSINLALGEKVQKEMLRDNEKPAFVELIFSVEDPKIIEALRELDVEVEDGCVILSRKITQSRAVGRVNGEAVSVSRMKEIASYLIDIHGHFYQRKNTLIYLMSTQSSRLEIKSSSFQSHTKHIGRLRMSMKSQISTMKKEAVSCHSLSTR